MRRRRLIAGVLSGWGLSVTGQSCLAAESSQKEEPSWDVIVVGGGGAGFAAAIAAREAGARKVLLLEKLSLAGGHTMLSSGSVNGIDPRRQTGAQRDSIDLMARQTYEAGARQGNWRLVYTLAAHSESMLCWLESMGVEWQADLYEAYGGVFRRSHKTADSRSGFAYMRVLGARANALGVDVRCAMPVVELIKEGDRVSGVIVDQDGEMRVFKGSSVILATGGFTANVAMRMRYDPRLGAHLNTTANPTGRAIDGATGDGILLGQALGAKVVDMSSIMLIPFWGGRVLDYVGADVFLNEKGQRFMNETLLFSQMLDELLVRTKGSMWVVTDAKSRKGATFTSKLASGVVKSALTIEDMAHGMGVSVVTLKETMARYNQFVVQGYDEDFARTRFTQAIDTPPYYYGKESFNVHYTCGGLKINENTEVLNEKDCPIKGLYAAGEVTGGIHGSYRLGGNGLTDIFVFGRIAGEKAAMFARQG